LEGPRADSNHPYREQGNFKFRKKQVFEVGKWGVYFSNQFEEARLNEAIA